MLIPVIPTFQKRRSSPKPKKATPTPPPVGNMILTVEHGVEPSEIVVTLNAAVTSYDDVDKMLGVSVDGEEGNWVYPQGINVLAPERVRFAFDGDVSDTLFWRVPGPSNWHFLDGDLGEPWTGEIE